MKKQEEHDAHRITDDGELEPVADYDLNDHDTNRQRHKQREFFKALGRKGCVEESRSDGKHKLIYYAHDGAVSRSEVLLSELKTADSEDDDRFKFGFVRFCSGLVLIMAASPFINELLPLGFGAPDWQVKIGLSVGVLVILGSILFAVFEGMSKELSNNFMDINAQWTNSVSEFLGGDIRAKMRGVRACMLTFRQLLKWRRWTAFFLPVFLLVSAVILLPIYAFELYHRRFEWNEVLITAAFGLLLWWSLIWYTRLIKSHTNWRDPTVQLSVMIAEMHQRFVLKFGAGAGAG